jgi:hypothetical protein
MAEDAKAKIADQKAKYAAEMKRYQDTMDTKAMRAPAEAYGKKGAEMGATVGGARCRRLTRRRR